MNNIVQAMQLPVEKLRPFEGHPFQVKDDAEMDQLVFSILTQGLLTPISVRPIENGEYEVISGHRRLHACKKAGIETVSALIYSLDRDAATIAMVDSNLHREKILPSEKAFAYKMKLEALKHQGKAALSQVATKSGRVDTASVIGEQAGESRDQVFRYIRLTSLVPPLLKLVDEGRIAFSPAVELSYLTKEEQAELWDLIEQEDATPSLSQAIRMKQLSRMAKLTPEAIYAIISEEKPNQKEQVRFKTESLKKYFPSNYSTQQMEKAILKLLEDRYRSKHRGQER